ncbi:MAG: DUF1648 domain-containing protein [Chloroflexi bacterium]|nr:DUF1648 domain-containing protein [Chloroflexota bacterium]
MPAVSSNVSGDHVPVPSAYEDHSSLPLERDRLSLSMLLLALAGNAALFLYVRAQFATLPAVIPLHFDPSGQPDRLAEKAGLFALPTIGLLIVGTNLLLGLLLRRHYELASRFLWGGAVLSQVLLALAVYNIIH